MFHVKHQSSQQLVGEGRRTQSHPQQLNHQPTTFHVKQSQLQNHEGKAENSRLGNTPPHFQLFPRSVFHVKPQLIFQAVTHIEASKSHKHIQTNYLNSNSPTFHVKHQASATNRGKATHPKRYLLQLNHPIMFHVKPLFHIPHSPNLRFT